MDKITTIQWEHNLLKSAITGIKNSATEMVDFLIQTYI